jgi:phospholipid N-methyltransferase
MKNIYQGWELPYFNNAKNFRKYQFSLIRKFIYGSVAEVGPGHGVNLAQYYKHASKIDLFEPSNNLYNILKRKFKMKNIKVFNKYFDFSKKKYNTILYLDVLEHIKNDAHEIARAYKSLSKNGHLIINVPAFSYLYSQFDLDIGHIKRYNKKDFQIITKNIKGKIILMKYYDSVGYFLGFISKLFDRKKYRNNFKLKILLWDKMIIISKLIDFLTMNLFGKSLLVIIKK